MWQLLELATRHRLTDLALDEGFPIRADLHIPVGINALGKALLVRGISVRNTSGSSRCPPMPPTVCPREGPSPNRSRAAHSASSMPSMFSAIRDRLRVADHARIGLLNDY